MIIKKIEIKNFRSIREASIELDDLTAFLGRNGAGKSTFLHAIDTFYNLKSTITEEDFFDKDITSNIEIKLTYGNLNELEKTEFEDYINDNLLSVKKIIFFENGKIIQEYYSSSLQIPEFAEIRKISSKRDRTSAWNELIDSRKYKELTKVKKADDIEDLMALFEKKYHELRKPFEKSEQFIGPKNIGGGKLDNFTKFVLIPAVREASDEANEKKGAIYQILDMIVFRKINSRKDLIEFRENFQEQIEKLYSPENLKELPELGNSISNTLKIFSPGSELKLNWDEPKLPEIQLPSAKATLIEDEFEGNVSHKGHGLQRALIVTLLQHLAMTITVIPESENSITEIDKELELNQGPDLIIAIEEPELYLHPSRCQYLSNLLLKLSKNPSVGLGAKNQVIYATHSPYFVDLQRFDQIRIVRKVPSPDTDTYQSIVHAFSFDNVVDILSKIHGNNSEDFTRESCIARALPIMDTIRNEGFFANIVVVVEGLCEVGVLWTLQEILNKDWESHDISIVPAEGKNNIDRPVIIFKGFHIKTYYIFDGDSRYKGKNNDKEKNAIKQNHKYYRLAGIPLEDFPTTQAYTNFAVFSDNIEDTIKEAIGNEVFIDIKKSVADKLGYNETNRVTKNVKGASCIIEEIYKKNLRVPILENIVEKITNLIPENKTSSSEEKL